MSSHVFDYTKWISRPVIDQLGNISSEVGRAMNAIRHHDEKSLDGAFQRGIDLIDASASVMSKYRRRELLSARELFTQAVEKRQPDDKLEAYFMQYAIAARTGR